MPRIDNNYINSIPRLTIDKLNDDGCFFLLEAFLRYVADDYCCALRSYIKDKKDRKSHEHYMKAREFFLSDYFANLTNLCGEDIVSRLDAKIMGVRNAGSY